MKEATGTGAYAPLLELLTARFRATVSTASCSPTWRSLRRAQPW